MGAEDEEQIVGPKLVSIIPIMRYAMRQAVDEYRDDDRTVSEYESLAEVEEDYKAQMWCVLCQIIVILFQFPF